MGLEIINELRKRKNLTSEQLAKKSGVPLGTLNKILSGVTKDPKLETLRAIAKVLECSLDDFDDNKDILANLDKNKNLSDTIRIFESLKPEFQEYVLQQIKALFELQEKQ